MLFSRSAPHQWTRVLFISWLLWAVLQWTRGTEELSYYMGALIMIFSSDSVPLSWWPHGFTLPLLGLMSPGLQHPINIALRFSCLLVLIFSWKYDYISITATLTGKVRLAMVLLIFSHWLVISLFPYTCWPFACLLLRNVLSPVFKIWLVGDGWLPDLLLFWQIYTNQNRIDLTWRQICKTME